MVADIQALMKDTSFLLKLFQFACCAITVMKLCEINCLKSAWGNLFVFVGAGGGLIATSILISTYLMENKNMKMEILLLAVYGAVNLIAAYHLYLYSISKRCLLSNSIFDRGTLMTTMALFAAISMLGDAFQKNKEA